MMRQLFQDPKAGKIEIVDLPEPALLPGHILVRNAYSVISPGTERLSVEAARSSYLKTARARPDLVRRVLDTVKREGVLATYRIVQNKLATPQALGYSSAGTVQAVGPGVGDLFDAGDRVACAGAGYASHAEVVSVPLNLAARVPDGVDLEAASFSTMGSIALHGVRQGEPTLGERWAVIGLGILGLFAVQILRANGVKVAAFDLAPDLVELARKLGAETGCAGGTDDQVQTAMAWSRGLGVDGVLVTAASKSDAPMVSAAGMCRDRGRVVAVGFVPFGLPREIAYPKELELRISRSYGPGRYDPEFEEKGNDYPLSYVRWTETRNMEAFLELVADGKVTIDSLITHRFDLDEAIGGYDALVSDHENRPLGMVIRYPEKTGMARDTGGDGTRTEAKPEPPTLRDGIGVGFIGAGSFATSFHMPRFSRSPGVRLRRVVDARGLTAHDAKRKFDFDEIGTDADELLADPSINLVCIMTRHDTHADFIVRSLRAGKHVFVEKPLALNDEQLQEIEAVENESPGILLVGYNRRFAPMVCAIRDNLASRGPLMMTYRVNAGVLPPGHWLNDPDVGGGRLIGEGCHFVDVLSSLTGDADIVSCSIRSSSQGKAASEDFVIQLGFADGSAGQVLYTSRGAPNLPKERLEVHAGGASAILEDYGKCTIWKGGKTVQVKKTGKGHTEEIAALLESVRNGKPSPIPIDVAARVARVTFGVYPRG